MFEDFFVHHGRSVKRKVCYDLRREKSRGVFYELV